MLCFFGTPWFSSMLSKLRGRSSSSSASSSNYSYDVRLSNILALSGEFTFITTWWERGCSNYSLSCSTKAFRLKKQILKQERICERAEITQITASVFEKCTAQGAALNKFYFCYSVASYCWHYLATKHTSRGCHLNSMEVRTVVMARTKNQLVKEPVLRSGWSRRW